MAADSMTSGRPRCSRARRKVATCRRAPPHGRGRGRSGTPRHPVVRRAAADRERGLEPPRGRRRRARSAARARTSEVDERTHHGGRLQHVRPSVPRGAPAGDGRRRGPRPGTPCVGCTTSPTEPADPAAYEAGPARSRRTGCRRPGGGWRARRRPRPARRWPPSPARAWRRRQTGEVQAAGARPAGEGGQRADHGVVAAHLELAHGEHDDQRRGRAEPARNSMSSSDARSAHCRSSRRSRRAGIRGALARVKARPPPRTDEPVATSASADRACRGRRTRLSRPIAPHRRRPCCLGGADRACGP